MAARCVLAIYVHDLNPVIFEITDSIKLRWYGFAYLLAFVAGYLLLKWMGDKKLWVLPGKVAGDFIAYAAVFGVFLGGRIGNVLIYQREELMNDPLVIFRVWEGGMASHGGILGLLIFTFVYARMKKVSWTALGDGLCVVAPLGIMFGRLANFINGELYGRVDKTFAWAMKFPNALWDKNTVEGTKPNLTQAAAARADKGGEYTQYYDQMIEGSDAYFDGALKEGTAEYEAYAALMSRKAEMLNKAVRENPEVKDAVAYYLEPRYPSQLFQAALEGLLLFLILFVMRVKFPKLAHGVLTGLFFIFYAIFRISMENFREPETANLMLLGTEWTMGQFLSLFMIAIGLAFILGAKLRVKKGTLLHCTQQA
ncbi:prolipoprotein diacylglyceryl transferase [Rubritalea tangerina]|uniref:Phosphatidylglycerol--prolipoprotein diacylglyceryl transferase n=2 Tax=Rubritalea tangerina TaxID=430798 RepID=A0ABW4Z9B7_9BACT